MKERGAAVSTIREQAPLDMSQYEESDSNLSMYECVCMYVCMYVCMFGESLGISVTYFVFILYICVWVYWGDGNKFMYVCKLCCTV